MQKNNLLVIGCLGDGSDGYIYTYSASAKRWGAIAHDRAELCADVDSKVQGPESGGALSNFCPFEERLKEK